MNSPIKVTEFAFIGYPMTDAPRARSFYEGVLNFKLTNHWEHEGKSWIEYELGDGALALSNMAGDKWKPSGDGPSLALEVEDFETTITTLREAGITFLLEPIDNGSCKLASVADPDGNSITLHKRAPQES